MGNRARGNVHTCVKMQMITLRLLAWLERLTGREWSIDQGMNESEVGAIWQGRGGFSTRECISVSETARERTYLNVYIETGRQSISHRSLSRRLAL